MEQQERQTGLERNKGVNDEKISSTLFLSEAMWFPTLSSLLSHLFGVSLLSCSSLQALSPRWCVTREQLEEIEGKEAFLWCTALMLHWEYNDSCALQRSFAAISEWVCITCFKSGCKIGRQKLEKSCFTPPFVLHSMSCRVGGAISNGVKRSEQSASWSLMASSVSSFDRSMTSFLFLVILFLVGDAEHMFELSISLMWIAIINKFVTIPRFRMECWRTDYWAVCTV